jgi:hypothetical protein
VPDVIVERADGNGLAHSLGKVEAAYRRGAAIERRREWMETWQRFLSPK